MPAPATMLTSLHSLLTGSAPITALVGSRIYASQAPQGAALPTLIYHVIAAPTEHTHDGHGLSEAIIQFDIDATTPTSARAVADTLADLIDGKRLIEGATNFEAIFHDGNEFTSVAESLTQGTTQTHRLTVHYRFLHQPA